MHHEVVKRLSLFLPLLPHSFDRESARLLHQDRIRVELTPKVMLALTTFSFEEQDVPQIPLVSVELDGPEGGSVLRHKIKQSVKKQARKARHRAATINLEDLKRLGFEEPRSRLEADANAHLLLGEIQKVLQVSLYLIPGTHHLQTLSQEISFFTALSRCCIRHMANICCGNPGDELSWHRGRRERAHRWHCNTARRVCHACRIPLRPTHESVRRQH